MKKAIKYIKIYYLFMILISLLLIGIYGVYLNIENNNLQEEILVLETKIEEQSNTIMEKDNEINRLEMIANEWMELFFNELQYRYNN